MEGSGFPLNVYENFGSTLVCIVNSNNDSKHIPILILNTSKLLEIGIIILISDAVGFNDQTFGGTDLIFPEFNEITDDKFLRVD